jgi:transposase
MPDSTIEIINGREGRRRWSVAEKLRIVAETHEPGATVGAVAARHDVYPSLLRTWRRHVRDGHLVAAPAQHFVPVCLTDPPLLAPAQAPPTVNNPLATDTIEIVLPDGSHVRVGSGVNLNALRRVVTALRG